MRETRIELQSGVLEKLYLEQGSTFVRNDLVVFALHDERRYINALQVLSEVRFRERLDTTALASKFPTPLATAGIVFDGDERRLTEAAFLRDFGGDLPEARARVLYAVQQPFHKSLLMGK